MVNKWWTFTEQNTKQKEKNQGEETSDTCDGTD